MRNFAALVLIGASATPAVAQTYTDLDQSVSQAIATAGMLPLTVHYQTKGQTYYECINVPGPVAEGPSQRCFPQTPMVDATQVNQVSPTFSNVTVTLSGPPTLGTITYTNFPDQFIQATQDSQNCSTYPNVIPMSLTLNATRSQSITISKSFTHSQGLTVGASASMFGVGVSASVNISNSSTSGTATTNGETGGYTISGGGTVTIPPQSRIIAFFRAYKIQASVPFTVVGRFDADISANDKGYKHLSDYIDASKRTVEIDGTIISDDNSTGEFQSDDAPFDASKCSVATPTISTPSPNLVGLHLERSTVKINNIHIKNM